MGAMMPGLRLSHPAYFPQNKRGRTFRRSPFFFLVLMRRIELPTY